MSLQERLRTAGKLLKPTHTIVVLENGQEVEEKRNENGEFELTRDSSNLNECSKEKDVPISNRRKKKVERARRSGFVIDNNPDLQLAKICDGLYLGSQDVAMDFTILNNEGITHIVNCATGVCNFYPLKFHYYKLELLDLPSQNILQHFYSVHDYIKDCIDHGGKILVHCNAGISRSSTFVISYLMKYQQRTLDEALGMVKAVRPDHEPIYFFACPRRSRKSLGSMFENEKTSHSETTPFMMSCHLTEKYDLPRTNKHSKKETHNQDLLKSCQLEYEKTCSSIFTNSTMSCEDTLHGVESLKTDNFTSVVAMTSLVGVTIWRESSEGDTTAGRQQFIK